jgi:hypothetical protein
MLIAIAAYSFVVPGKLRELDKAGESGENHKKYEAFVADVLTGKRAGTPDQYVDAMRVQQVAIKNARERSASVLDSLRDLGWAAVFGVVFQLVAIYSIHRRLKKT